MAADVLTAIQKMQQDNAVALHRIVESLRQWPGHRTVGQDACQAAVSIAVHCDHDPAFQQRLLRLLRAAVTAGEATRAQLAHLHDRCLVNARQPQLYGTQHWYRSDGQLQPHPIADLAQLDTRRAGADLPPLRRAGPAPPRAPRAARLLIDLRYSGDHPLFSLPERCAA
ncbi:DUF6624 domain-containing protein [Streptomyces avermitilis]|uniref:DUF6624 domain-containing protein n=1 Tax=Streptomyces avermitilis TaxID=33903 RepID=UPI003817AF40